MPIPNYDNWLIRPYQDSCAEEHSEECPCCGADFDPGFEVDDDEGFLSVVRDHHVCVTCEASACEMPGMEGSCRCSGCGQQHPNEEGDGVCYSCLDFREKAHAALC
jgi:hypothetical protein